MYADNISLPQTVVGDGCHNWGEKAALEIQRYNDQSSIQHCGRGKRRATGNDARHVSAPALPVSLSFV